MLSCFMTSKLIILKCIIHECADENQLNISEIKMLDREGRVVISFTFFFLFWKIF